MTRCEECRQWFWRYGVAASLLCALCAEISWTGEHHWQPHVHPEHQVEMPVFQMPPGATASISVDSGRLFTTFVGKT